MQHSPATANAPESPDLTLVVPMFNDKNGVDAFFKEVFSILDGADFSVEVIAVNDGSTDGTLEKLKEWSRRDARLRTFDLSRNFGKDPALCVGIGHARGKALIPLDADLHDPPSLIPGVVAKWREGYEVVYARRIDRKSENFSKRSTADGFHKVFNWISEISIPENTVDFRLIDRKVIEAVRRLPEHNRFMKGLFAWVGFRQAELTFARPGSEVGLCKWGYWKLWNFALDGITAFSALPMRVWTYIGDATALLSIAYALCLVFRTIFFGVDAPGYASIISAVLILGGLQLLSLGIIGEYLGRPYLETKERPVYIVREVFENDGAGNGPGR